MNFDNLSQEFQHAFKKLNEWLKKNNMSMQILMGGASAMRIAGIISRDSKDIDSFIAICSSIKERIKEISEELGLDYDWLNDQASAIPLPDGAEGRCQELETPLTNIKISILSRKDMIILKINAAVTRGEQRDIDDLLIAKPTKTEFDAAVSYIKTKQRPDDLQFQEYQDQDIETLKKGLFRNE